MTAASAAAILGDSLLYAVLPVVWPQLGLELAAVGVLLSVNRWVRLATNPLAGWTMARFGARVPFIAAVFLAALTTAGYAIGRGFWPLLLARAAWGLSFSYLRLGGYLAALGASSASTRGYYLGFFYGGMRFGSFIAALFGGILTDALGFGSTAWVFAGVSLLGAIAVLRERPPVPVRSVRAEPAGHPAPATTPGSGPARLVAVYWLTFSLALVASGLITATLGLWLSLQLGDVVGLMGLGIASATGALLSTRFLVEFGWTPWAGRLSDRFGRRAMLILALLLEACALGAFASADSFLTLSLSAVALFLCDSASRVGAEATAGDLAPPEIRARVMSWYATASDIGAATGPLVGYWMAAHGALGSAYWAAAGLLLLGAGCYAVVFGRYPAGR